MPRPVLVYVGGKYRIAPWVISHFPPHKVYLEPFGGAASVLMSKPPCGHEIYNELNGEIVNVFRVLQNPDKAASLEYKLRFTPYSYQEFQDAYNISDGDDDIERARKTIIKSIQGVGGGGTTRKSNVGFSYRVYDVKSFTSFPDSIKAFTQRLRHVVIDSRDGIYLIECFNMADALIYVDPPYVQATWNKSDLKTYGGVNFNDSAQETLLNALRKSKAMVVLSGYMNDLYMDMLAGWKLEKKETINFKSEKRTEYLWINPHAVERGRNTLPLLAEAK